MKKILTLLIAFGVVAGVQAQSSSRYESRDVILGGPNNNRSYDNNNNNRYGYSFSARERDQQIDRINRDYDQRIRMLQRERRMNNSQKRSQVQRLEDARRNEIRMVWDRYRDNRNQYRDNDRRNDKRW